MKTHSGTSSFFPQLAASGGGSGGAAVAPAPDDSSTSFEDLLKQQVGGSPSSASWKTIAADLAANASTTPTTSLAADVLGLPPVTPPAAPATPVDPNAATILPPTTTPVTTTPLQDQLPPPVTPDPTSMLPVLKKPTPSGNPLPDDNATAEAPPAKVPAKSPTIPLYTGSSALVHAAILAASARQTSGAKVDLNADSDPAESAPAATAEDELAADVPLPKMAGKASPTMEKKSASSASEGSFIQLASSSGTTPWATLGASISSLTTRSQGSGNKQVTNNPSSSKVAIGDSSRTVLTPTGMANGKKDGDMNATLDLSDMIVSTGTNPMVAKNSADVHILLGTNQDFKDALGHVMQVAELSNMSKSTPPLRVAIEIQTPPGAIVNVYVSKQDDGYRAQLSANDPQALSWVQDQISSLKQTTDVGVSVRWLPAQLETTSASSSSSSSHQGNGWDRGGQGQQNQQQQPDERQQGSRQKRGIGYSGRLAPIGATPFMEALGVLGRAA